MFLFYWQCITYGKNPLAVSVIHLHESRFSFFFFQEKYTRLFFSFWKNMTTKYISNSLFSWIKIKQHMPILFIARENKGYALKKHTVHFYTYPLLQRQVACIPPHGWVSFVFVLLRKPTLCQTTTNVFKFLNRVGIILFF